MALLTHSEYKNLVATTDVANVEMFRIVEQQKEDTYMVNLIGSTRLAKVLSGDYDSIKTLCKKALAQEIYRYFVEIGNVIVTPIGTVNRISDYSKSSEFVDKQNKIKAISEVQRAYETQIMELIEDDEYTATGENEKISTAYPFQITSIGDTPDISVDSSDEPTCPTH